MPLRERTPVIVLAGSLGSGKTTLLYRILRSGGRFGVIINDFGAVNIDALLVTGHVDAARTLSGGCLCCLADASELDAALSSLADPALGLDAILIEASGIADPRSLARMVLASSEPGVRFGGVVLVADATGGIEPDHVRVASLVVLNKCDLADPAPVRATVRAAASEVPLVETTDAAIAPELLVDLRERAPSDELDFSALYTRAPHPQASSIAFEDPRPVHPHRLFELLEAPLPGLARLKGVVHVGAPDAAGRFVVHRVGAWVGVERLRWDAGTVPSSALVAIGTDLDADGLRERFEGLLRRDDERLSRWDLAGLRRYAAAARPRRDPRDPRDSEAPGGAARR